MKKPLWPGAPVIHDQPDASGIKDASRVTLDSLERDLKRRTKR